MSMPLRHRKLLALGAGLAFSLSTPTFPGIPPSPPVMQCTILIVQVLPLELSVKLAYIVIVMLSV
jgi:hypothetical protein